MIGQILRQRYKIIKQLGAGGFGETYLAEDLDIPATPKPKCVLKRLQPQAMHPDIERLFQKEGEILYKLGQNYDQIPKLFAYFQQNGEFYLIQEFIDGHDLSREITPGKQWSEVMVIKFLQQILEVLAYVHQNNVIHRDIKPANIMRLRRNGKLVLIDFGIVKEIGTVVVNASGHTSHTVAIGTPGYMPSEQALGKPKPSSDIYALGMTAIQALTGVSPHLLPEDNNGEVIWQNRVQVSEALAKILTKMVRYDFRQRYADANEVLQVLNRSVGRPSQRFNQPGSQGFTSPVGTPLPRAVSLKPINIGSKYGYTDKSGQVIIQPQFDYGGDFSEGLALVVIGDKYGYINQSGQVVIPIKFDADEFAAFSFSGEIYGRAFSFSEGLALVKIGGKYGYIDQSGRVAILPQFDYAEKFSEGLAQIQIVHKWGYIDKNGWVVIQPQFYGACPFSEGLAVVYTNQKYGYIDKTGQWIIQPQFNLAKSFSGGRAEVFIDQKLLGIRIGDQARYIDKKGNFID